jgi:RNA polymerase sigma factor (sigma-70 family)
MCNSCIIELIEKLKKQDKSSLDILNREFGGLICYYAKRLGGEDYLAELRSALIEILYKINIQKFKRDDSDSINRYISVALRNKYIALSNKKQEYEKVKLGKVDDIYTYSVNFEERILVKDMLELLSSKQRQIITYKYIYGYSDIEISRFLNISRQAVNRLKIRAINTIREYYGIEN